MPFPKYALSGICGGIIYKSINSGLPKRLVMFVCWGEGERAENGFADS